MKITKKQIRINFEKKYGRKLPNGAMQLSDHGCGNKSIQIHKKGKLIEDVNVSGLWD
jgi:hypothetical protein